MNLAQIVAAAADVVRGTRQNQLGDPTPCADWDVRELTGHLFQVVTAVRIAGHGGPVPAELWSRQLTGADFGEAAKAWDRPPAAMIDMGGMPMPAETVAAMLGADLVLHGWDLARATGQQLACSAEAAEQTWLFVAGFAGQGRGMGLFGPPVPVAEDAPPLVRALALSGRDPAWRAAPV
jgi:uncharacterized protein (TIGR03086 family)